MTWPCGHKTFIVLRLRNQPIETPCTELYFMIESPGLIYCRLLLDQWQLIHAYTLYVSMTYTYVLQNDLNGIKLNKILADNQRYRFK